MKMMKLVMLILAVCSLTSCSAVKSEQILQTSSTPSNEGHEFQRTNPSYPAIDKLSMQYGFAPLSQTKADEGIYVVRVWSSVDLDYERCFSFERNGELRRARLIAPNVEYGEELPKDPKRIPTTIQDLSQAANWTDVDELFSRYRISPPLPYSQLTDSAAPIVDEGIITIEVFNEGRYDVVSFRAFSKATDSRKLVGFCKSLEDTFQIRIGCEHR